MTTLDDKTLQDIETFYANLEGDKDYKRPVDYVERYVRVVLNNNRRPAHLAINSLGEHYE
jgi:hypothetical protein